MSDTERSIESIESFYQPCSLVSLKLHMRSKFTDPNQRNMHTLKRLRVVDNYQFIPTSLSMTGAANVGGHFVRVMTIETNLNIWLGSRSPSPTPIQVQKSRRHGHGLDHRIHIPGWCDVNRRRNPSFAMHSPCGRRINGSR